MANSTFSLLDPVSKVIIQRLRLYERLSSFVSKMQVKIIALHGSHEANERTKGLFLKMISTGLALLTLFILLSLVGGIELLLVGLIFSFILIPFITLHGLDKKITQKRQMIIMELPEFLNKLTLLVNAGETVQKAIIRCLEQTDGEEELNPLYIELMQVSNELRNRRPFQQAMEDFSKRCSLQETAIFTTTVLLNYRRGGDEFVYALRDLSRILWEKRKALTKTLGEEASSKLVFPLVLIFLIVMVIVGAPAILMMG